MDQNAGPDVVTQITLTSNLSEFEVNSINYVVKRYMASAVKKMTDEVLLNCTSLTYKFMHPVAIGKNLADLNERHMSLLMGYPYPYTLQQQPRSLRHLSLDVVVPFLYDRKEELKALAHCDVLDGDDNISPCTTQEMKAKKSPIVQSIFTLIRESKNNSSPEIQGMTPEDQVISHVNSWYMKWHSADQDNDPQLRAILVSEVKSFLLNMRYRNDDQYKKEIHEEMTRWKKNMASWQEATQSLRSFQIFVKKYGLELSGNQKLDDNQKKRKPLQIEVEEIDYDDRDDLLKQSKPSLQPHKVNQTKTKGMVKAKQRNGIIGLNRKHE